MSIENLEDVTVLPVTFNGGDAAEDVDGSGIGEALFGNGGNDKLHGRGGDDLVDGGAGDDLLRGGSGSDTVNGGDGEDRLFGGNNDDRLVGNKGNDRMFGGSGRDLLVWNNGDGSDLMDGGRGDDRVQVNFNTDLVNEDLQNKDVAEFSVTAEGVQFARIELNDQAVNGLFQLDIRETETLETNFGGGDDAAVIVGNVLNAIYLDLDGGDGVDTLDLSQASGPVAVNLDSGAIDIDNGSGQDASAVNFENVIGTESNDVITGDDQGNVISGLGGVDQIFGGAGDDELVANKGNDFVFGGAGDDLIVWNNGDGSDLFDGGADTDRVQVNFNTDLVNDDLQNKDVAEFSVTAEGVQFARIELNDQAVNGLFQLDIRETEVLETNFGGGDDEAVLVGNVLEEILLDLDGGDGVDTLDLLLATGGIDVDLAAGTVGTSTAVNFENVTGTTGDDVIRGDDQNNVIRGGGGNDDLSGGGGNDTFLFFEEDAGVSIIQDFVFGEDRLVFATSDPSVTRESILALLEQDGDAVALTLNGREITIENALVADFGITEIEVV